MLSSATEQVQKAVSVALQSASRYFQDGNNARVMFTGRAPNKRPTVVTVDLSEGHPDPRGAILSRIKDFPKVSPLQVHRT